MEEQKNAATVNGNNTKDLVAATAVITSTVVLTIGAWRVAAELMHPPLRHLRERLEKKVENNN